MADCKIECTVTDSEVLGDCTNTKPVLLTLPAEVTPPKVPTAKTVTTETVDGTGVFDVYMRAGMAQLDTQYEKGRIKGTDYAQAYIAMTQLMMTEANKFVIGMVQAEIAVAMFSQQYMGAAYDVLVKENNIYKINAETDLLCQQIAELKANGKVERELKKSQKQTQIGQAELYKRQITSFREKTSLDASKILMDAWAVQAAEDISGAYELLSMDMRTAGSYGRGVTEELITSSRTLVP